MPLFAYVFIQPLQFFTQLDVSMPRITRQSVPLARKHEEAVVDAQLLQGALKRYTFEITHAHIAVALDDMGWRLDTIHAEESGFSLVDFRRLPRLAVQIPGVVPGNIVITPVGGVFDCAGSGHSHFEARCLR